MKALVALLLLPILKIIQIGLTAIFMGFCLCLGFTLASSLVESYRRKHNGS